MLVRTRVASNKSPWLQFSQPGDVHTIAVSYGEGRFVASGEVLAKLREKHVDGSTVTFTVDYYAGDDVGFIAPEYAKTYTLTFFYGRYRYESAVEAA